MLEFLRRQSQSWLVWVLLAVISIVFIFFFGPQSMGFNPSTTSRAMVVNGTTIQNTQLDASVQRMSAFGMRVPDSMFYEVKRDIAQDVAMTLVLADHARKAGLRIGDDELRCYIVDWNPDYRVKGDFICRQFPRVYKALYPNVDLPFYTEQDGAFSSRYGEQVRRWFALSIEKYESYKRAELLAVRYLDVLAGGLPVTTEELEVRWRAANEKLTLEYVAFDPSAGAEDFSDAELAAFKTSSAAAIAAAYEEGKENYATPRTVQLRRIYIRKPEGDSAEALARVQALFEEAKAPGADFAELARTNSENPGEAEKGGDMGARDVSLIAEEFVRALDGLSVGQVALVEQNYAWSVVLLESDVPAGYRSLADTEDEIARTLLAQSRAAAGTDAAKANAAQLLQAARDNASSRLDVALAASGLEGVEVSSTGAFSVEPQAPNLSGIDPQLLQYIRIATPAVGEIPGVGKDSALMGELFGMSLDAPLVDRVVEVGGRFFVLRLVESTKGATPSDEDLGNMHAQIQRERANALIGADAVRGRILAHTGAELPSVITDMLTSAKIRYEESAFTPPKGMEMLD